MMKNATYIEHKAVIVSSHLMRRTPWPTALESFSDHCLVAAKCVLQISARPQSEWYSEMTISHHYETNTLLPSSRKPYKRNVTERGGVHRNITEFSMELEDLKEGYNNF